MVKCDVCTLDNGLDNSYAEHLLSGKSLPINYNTYVSQIQTILSGTNGQQKVLLNITRALTRLKSVFVSLWKPTPATRLYVARKKWNTFYSPMFPYVGVSYNAYNSAGEVEFQLQVGNKQFRE